MKNLIIILISLIPAGLQAQDTVWTKTFGTPAADGAKSVCIANDDGYVVAGYSFATPSKIAKTMLIKISGDGVELWRTILDLPGSKYPADICRRSDAAGYLLCGKSQEEGQLFPDLWIAEVSNSGRLVWSKTIGGDGFDVGEAICSTRSGDYLIAGTTTSIGLGSEDLYALKIDGNGQVIWEKTFGAGKPDTGSDVIETSDGYYLFGGSTSTYDNPPSLGRNRDMFVVKTDTNGILIKSAALWVMAASQGAYDACNSLCELANGDYAAVGVCSQEGVEPCDIGVIRMNTELVPVWKKNVEVGNYFDFGYSGTVYTADNGLLICGMKNLNSSMQSDGVMLKMEADGKTSWKLSFGGPGKEAFQAIATTGQGDYVLAGYSNSNESDDMNFWLMKFSENASGVDSFINRETVDCRIWPNPASDAISVSTVVPGSGYVQLQLTDVSGRIVRDYRLKGLRPGLMTKHIDITGLLPGMYFCTVNCNGNRKTIELIIK